MTRSEISRPSRIVLHTPGAGPRRPDGAVSGQHAAWRPAPWHQRMLVALIAGGLLAGLTIAGLRTWDVAPTCVPVQVVAAPEIAPFVGAGRAEARRRGLRVLGRPARVDGRVGGARAPGSSPNAEPPHVWMPESTQLLARARARGATAVPAAGVSVVSSPVVMALTADAVGKLGPGRPTCDALLRADDVVVGAPDPTRDPMGLAALLEAQADLGSGRDGDAALVAFLRRLQGHVVGPGDDPTRSGPSAPPVTAFPTTEQELLRHNVDHPDATLTAVYPSEAPTWMDYPFTVLDDREPCRAGRGDAAARRAAGAGRAGGALGGRVPHHRRAGAGRPPRPTGAPCAIWPAPAPFAESADVRRRAAAVGHGHPQRPDRGADRRLRLDERGRAEAPQDPARGRRSTRPRAG